MEQVVTRLSFDSGPALARVNPIWQDQTVVVIGSGPSLTRAQVELCKHLPTIAVNDAYLMVPWANVCYFADSKWYRWQKSGCDGHGKPQLGLSAADVKSAWHHFAGLKVSISTTMLRHTGAHDVLILQNGSEQGGGASALSQNPTAIKTGSNSGFQALNIATLSGSTRILMLGIDGKQGSGGKRHFFGDHPDRSDAPYEQMRHSFASAASDCRARGITLINCSPGSRIDSMARMSLEDALSFLPIPDFIPSPLPAAPPAPSAFRSVYVLVSEMLSQGPKTIAELRASFPSGLDAALLKGRKKQTLIESNGVWQRAPGL